MTATVLFLPGGGIPAGRRVIEGGDGGAWLGCVLRGVGLVDTPSRVTKGFFVGALLGVWGSIGCSCWALMSAGRWLWLVVCGVVLCENCIVDASIFLFCVLVFIPVCLCVRVFCYGRMVDALAC